MDREKKKMSNWPVILIFVLGLILITSLVFFSINQIITKSNCEVMGYIPVETANDLINITNELIDYNNACYNMTLEHLPYFIDK